VAIEPKFLKSPRIIAVEVSNTFGEAKVLVERWRQEYNHVRPHSSLGVSASCAGGHYANGSVGVQFRFTPPDTYASRTNSRSGTEHGVGQLEIINKQIGTIRGDLLENHRIPIYKNYHLGFRAQDSVVGDTMDTVSDFRFCCFSLQHGL